MTSNPLVPDLATRMRRTSRAVIVGLFAVIWGLVAPSPAHASFLPPEIEDKVVSYLAIFIIFFVPIVGIVLFWLVHILPEQIAHKRHHPQFEAIRTLCLLSLVFGGVLWPLAWLWAYTKPVAYKMAYGTDKHPDYYKEQGLPEPDYATNDIRERLAVLQERGVPASEIEAIRTDLDAIESRLAAATGNRSEAV